jgi:cytochrome c5
MLWARPYGEISAGEDIMNSLCSSCHSKGSIAENKIPLISTHPEEWVISNNLRFDMKRTDFTPIYDKHTGEETSSGSISCPSCHNAHQWSSRIKEKGPYRNLEGNATNSFLRNVSFDNVCIDCHGLDALFRFKYFHDLDNRVEERTYQPNNMLKIVNGSWINR